MPRLLRPTARILLVLFRPGASRARAQRFPNKPIRIVVPFPAGGAVDTVARTLGQKLTDAWRQPIVVENRPGAGGNIGAGGVARAAPDGYSILMTTHGHAISASLYRKPSHDPVKDFTPITQLIANAFLVLVVNPSVLPTWSLKELITLAKAKPGGVTYGSTGLGAPPHLATELLKMRAGIDLVHIPYKGDAPLTSALLSGEVHTAFVPLVAALSHLKAGRLRALGITSGTRSPAIPEVPSVAEAGLPGFEFTGWLAAFAPARTPRKIVNRLQGELARILAMPDIRERLPAWGYEPVGGTPAELAAKLRADIRKYADVIREAGIPRVG